MKLNTTSQVIWLGRWSFLCGLLYFHFWSFDLLTFWLTKMFTEHKFLLPGNASSWMMWFPLCNRLSVCQSIDLSPSSKCRIWHSNPRHSWRIKLSQFDGRFDSLKSEWPSFTLSFHNFTLLLNWIQLWHKNLCRLNVVNFPRLVDLNLCANVLLGVRWMLLESQHSPQN